MPDNKKILVLGGGFAGMYAARELERLLKPGQAEISLVNQENYSVYQPMLPEVISGSIGLTDVVSPIRRVCRRSHLIMREVESIDLANKLVTVSPGFRPRRLELRYDYLVIALGGVTNFYGMPGMIENAKPFRTLADAVALRNHLIHALEEADVETDPERRKQAADVRGGGRRIFRRRGDGRAERLRSRGQKELFADRRCARSLRSGPFRRPHPAGNDRRFGSVRPEDPDQARRGNPAERPADGGHLREGHFQIRDRGALQDDCLDGALRSCPGAPTVGMPERQGPPSGQ